jgi:hypothetical protein
MVTFGTWPKDTMVTGMPFGSVNFRGVGIAKSFAGPAAGGFSFCCANIGADAAARVSAAPTVRSLSTERVMAALRCRHPSFPV